MYSRLQSLLVGAALIAPTLTIAQTAEQHAGAVDPVVTVTDRKHLLPSALTGRVNALYVSLPASYGRDTLRKYPVVYVLDGQWDLKLVTSIQGNLLYDGYTPEMIIVGVTYAGPDAKYEELRTMDFTPSVDSGVPGSGGGPKFLRSLETELIPFVEKTYRADPAQRVLMGCSYGGLFALYAMFTKPELFSAYIAASPAVNFDGDYSRRQEADYARRRMELPARLYLTVGEMEGLAYPVRAFMKQLSERGYRKLELETRVIDRERHTGQKPESYNRGLRFAFGGKALSARLDSLSFMMNNIAPEIPLSASDAAKYEGVYELGMADGKPARYRIFLDAGTLKVRPEDRPNGAMVLRYLGNDTFGMVNDPTVRATVLFENGRATKIRVVQQGNTTMGTRRP
jgi:predicted alpha/beta superfamily hydrolase